MAKAYLAVRAEVPEGERARFDHWYETNTAPTLSPVTPLRLLDEPV
jgi:hypothetical protein